MGPWAGLLMIKKFGAVGGPFKYTTIRVHRASGLQPQIRFPSARGVVGPWFRLLMIKFVGTCGGFVKYTTILVMI